MTYLIFISDEEENEEETEEALFTCTIKFIRTMNYSESILYVVASSVVAWGIALVVNSVIVASVAASTVETK